jgi:hypothetical protein
MTTLVFNATDFRTQFPAFADVTAFPTATLQMYWNNAICYMDDNGGYGFLQGACRQYALYCLTAHLTALSVMVLNGQVPGYVTQATIDKISASLQEPPKRNQWQWWLNTSPYGQQLLAQLTVKSVGGWLVGGVGELGGFQRIGGIVAPAIPSP